MGSKKKDNVRYAIEMEGISKSFGRLEVLKNVNLRLKEGEILALLGENGAGKTTLMSILFGLLKPDEGTIKRKGEEVRIKGPRDAGRLGIGMVHQQFKLVEAFSVLENIVLGEETTKWKYVLSQKETRKKAEGLCAQYGFAVDLDAKVEDITMGSRQKTEILKMLYRGADVLIFDEPTSVLTPAETRDFLDMLKKMKSEGRSILFISHKLNEIMEVADRCAVLKRGAIEATLEIQKTSKEELSRLMVGRDVSLTTEKKEAKPGNPILRVENLSVEGRRHAPDKVKDVTFEVHAGEIVTIAGIDGNGQKELIEALSGERHAKGGKIHLKDEDITGKSIKGRRNCGVSHIPDDVQNVGLLLGFSIEDNLVLTSFNKPQFTVARFILNRTAINENANKIIQKYDVRGNGDIAKEKASSFSGGNQQKAVIGRELDSDPLLLLAVQPTRGLDVGAIEGIRRSLVDLRDEGKAILLVSFELDEVFDLSDVILVMFDGEIVGRFKPNETTPEELGLYMAGGKRK